MGDITNDSLLPFIDQLQISSKEESEAFIKYASRLKTLDCLVLKGNIGSDALNSVFRTIRFHPTIEDVRFENLPLSKLPDGYEGLVKIKHLSFTGIDDPDHAAIGEQLLSLPNLESLKLEIYTIYDLPDHVLQIKNLQTLILINTDEAISGSDSVLVKSSGQFHAYDFRYERTELPDVRIQYISTSGEIDTEEYRELTRRFVKDLSSSTAEISPTYIPFYNNVKPPLKGIDVLRENFTASSEKENVIVAPSGTILRIPSNAFIDKNGKPATGMITVSYREFRDPVDFMVSGIPMKYDTSGQISNFESAGMFELTASTGDQPLELAPGKKIDMNFATTSKDSTYNFYAFNDSTGNWEYKSKPKKVKANERILIKPFSNAYNVYRNNMNHSYRSPDRTKFNDRFESADYIYTSYLDTNYRHFRHHYKKDRINKSTALIALIRPDRIRKTKEGEIVFKFRFLNSSHPELNEFNNVYFACTEDISSTEFRKKYFKNKQYNDIRISQNGSMAEIRMKGIKNTVTLNAELVTLNDKNQVKQLKNPTARFKKYNHRLKTREKIFNREAAKGELYYPTNGARDKKEKQQHAYNLAKKLMSAEELKMSFDEWIRYAEQIEKQEDAIQKTRNTLVQSISIPRTGIYNCDQIQRIEKPVEILASYSNQNSEKVFPTVAYVMDKKKNSVFQYDGYRGYSPSNIVISGTSSASNTLLGINADGSVIVFKPDDFKKHSFKDQEEFEFVVKDLGNGFSNVNELKKLLGM